MHYIWWFSWIIIIIFVWYDSFFDEYFGCWLRCLYQNISNEYFYIDDRITIFGIKLMLNLICLFVIYIHWKLLTGAQFSSISCRFFRTLHQTKQKATRFYHLLYLNSVIFFLIYAHTFNFSFINNFILLTRSLFQTVCFDVF